MYDVDALSAPSTEVRLFITAPENKGEACPAWVLLHRERQRPGLSKHPPGDGWIWVGDTMRPEDGADDGAAARRIFKLAAGESFKGDAEFERLKPHVGTDGLRTITYAVRLPFKCSAGARATSIATHTQWIALDEVSPPTSWDTRWRSTWARGSDCAQG